MMNLYLRIVCIFLFTGNTFTRIVLNLSPSFSSQDILFSSKNGNVLFFIGKTSYDQVIAMVTRIVVLQRKPFAFELFFCLANAGI